VQYDAAEAGTHVDQRRSFGGQRNRVEQAVDVGDRRRLVVSRIFEARPDCLRIELA
jgi:hypothetical protein